MHKIKTFRKIEGTRTTGQKYIMSHEELWEYAKCANDPIYFIEKYLDIKLRDYQKAMIKYEMDSRFLIEFYSKQLGSTMIQLAMNLWKMTFKIKHTIFIITHNPLTEMYEYDTLFRMYLKLPMFLKCGITKMKKGKNLEFENGSKIFYNTYTKHVAIGFNVDTLILNYFAKSKYQDTVLRNMLPITLASSKSQLIINSMPNGIDYFYDLVTNAERKEGDPKKNAFHCHRIYWWEVPGRDAAWKAEEIIKLGSEETFDKEYDLQFITTTKKKNKEK